MKNDESWRERCVRLLHIESNIGYLEFTDLRDVKALSDLKDEGFIDGDITPNEAGVPVNARITGPTMKGRLLAEDMERWIFEHSFIGALKRASGWIGGWITGIATAIIIHYLTNG